ncbi:hypothetical protein QEN19_002653 [Hanseniaspora menglaensis]
MALRNYLYSKHKQDDKISNMIFHGREKNSNDIAKLPTVTENSLKNIVNETEQVDDHRSKTLTDEDLSLQINYPKFVLQEVNGLKEKIILEDELNLDKNTERSNSTDTVVSSNCFEAAEDEQKK